MRWVSVERMMLAAISFTLGLLVFRIIYWHHAAFLFIPWNLFLAGIPLLVSRRLEYARKLNIKSFAMLALWLLFLPNAPYIITDIFHFYERPPVPTWFDLLVITSAAWNGLLLGIISLLQVEQFLLRHISEKKVNMLMSVFILACSFGIYLGRFLRLNSWDVVTRPYAVARHAGHPIISPFHNLPVWAFTIFFDVLLWLIYFTIRQLHHRTPVREIF